MKLTNRSFQDIQVLAQRVMDGDDFETDLENFARFSGELKAYLYQHIDDPVITERLDRLPEIDFKSQKTTVWSIFLPKSSIEMYDKYRRNQEVVHQVREAASIFSSIHMLLRDELDL